MKARPGKHITTIEPNEKFVIMQGWIVIASKDKPPRMIRLGEVQK